MRFSSSGVIVTSMEAMSVFSCSIEVAPMMLEVTKGRELTKASAICAGSRPNSLASADVFADRGLGGGVLVALAAVEQGGAGAGRPGAVEIFAGEIALRQRRIGEQARPSRACATSASATS